MDEIQEALTSKMRTGVVRILRYRICLAVCSYLSKDKAIGCEIVLVNLRNNVVLEE